MSKTKKPVKPKTISPADIVRLGSDAASLKQSSTAKEWKAFVKNAHTKGFTVAGAASSAPDALKERTASSLRDQAAKNVASAYAPAKDDLKRQSASITALESKRSADHSAYQQWLASQMEKLRSDAAAADTLVAQRLAESQAASQANATGQIDAAKQAAAATGGYISDPNQSASLNGLQAQATRNNEVASQQRSQRVADAGNAAAQMNVAATAALANADVEEGKRRSESNLNLRKINESLAKVDLEQGSKAAEETQRLMENQATYAQSNREYGAAAEKLGLEQDKFALDQKATQQKYAIDLAKYKQSVKEAKDKSAIARAKLDIDYNKIASQDGRAAADRALRRRIADQQSADRAADRTAADDRAAKDRAVRRAGQKGGTSLTSGQENTSIRAMTRVRDIQEQIQDLHAKYKVPHTKSRQSFPQVLRKRGALPDEIALAEHMRTHGGKIVDERYKRLAISLGIRGDQLKQLTG